MAYNHFKRDRPDGSVETGPEVLASTRVNFGALNDGVLLSTMPMWDMTPSGGTPDQPDEILYVNAVEQLRKNITWGLSGGAEGNPTTVFYEYSSDSGSNFDPIGTITFTYDVNGNVTGSSWS